MKRISSNLLIPEEGLRTFRLLEMAASVKRRHCNLGVVGIGAILHHTSRQTRVLSARSLLVETYCIFFPVISAAADGRGTSSGARIPSLEVYIEIAPWSRDIWIKYK